MGDDRQVSFYVEKNPGVVELKAVAKCEWEDGALVVRLVRWPNKDYILFYDAVWHRPGDESECIYLYEKTCSPVDALPRSFAESWRRAQTDIGVDPRYMFTAVLSRLAWDMSIEEIHRLYNSWEKFVYTDIPVEA